MYHPSHQRIFNCSLKFDGTMGIGLKHTILLLLLVSFAAIYLPHAKCACAGPCVVSGSSSYNFMGDPAVNLDMSSPDEFIRESLGSGKMSLSVKSLTQKNASNNSSSLSQTMMGNVSQNSIAVLVGNDSQENETSGNATSDSKIVKLGDLGMQDNRVSTLAFDAFNNNMF
jgi:hypothetical protein